MRAIKHPGEATLALHAGGDLGRLAQWRVERHLKQCETCLEELAAFQGVRRMVADMSSMPDIPWNRLAAEMQANIRLGLAAGECVRESPSPREFGAWFTGLRAALAVASLTAVAAAVMVLQRPAPAMNQMTLRATEDGIQVSQGSETLGMKHGAGIKNVSYSANAQGSIGESYVDPVTGDVIMTRVSW
jgi:hypothetical protein